MKSKTSITLSQSILKGMDEFLADFKSRSDFIETAVFEHKNRQHKKNDDPGKRDTGR